LELSFDVGNAGGYHMENVKHAKGLECYQYERTTPCHHDIILPFTFITSGPFVSLLV